MTIYTIVGEGSPPAIGAALGNCITTEKCDPKYILKDDKELCRPRLQRWKAQRPTSLL